LTTSVSRCATSSDCESPCVEPSSDSSSPALREGDIIATRKGRLLIGTGISLGAAAGFGSSAEAAVDTITVTSLADPGDGDCATNGCTPREAITQADDGDTADVDHIVFQSGLSGTVTLNGTELPLIDEPLYIDGPGAGTLTLDGNDSSRILEIDLNNFLREVKIEGLRLTGGFADQGGAIHSYRSGLTLENTTLVSNYCAGCGGGVWFVDDGVVGAGDTPVLNVIGSMISENEGAAGGGGLCISAGSPVIRDSIISGNKGGFSGGGISAGGLYADGMTIEGSTISNNQALFGHGGGAYLLGKTTILRSTISGNYAHSDGGGVMMVSQGPSSIQQSTISNNYSDIGQGGGVATAGGMHLDVHQSTIAGNHFGGVSAGAWDSVALSGSVVADNTAGTVADVVGGPHPAGLGFSAGFSLIENPGGEAINAIAPNVIGSDPQLGPLAANGGPTQTMMPASTSPAIDEGLGDGAGSDQRGQSRVFDAPTIANAAGGDGADIGAVELQSSEYAPPPPVTTPQSAFNRDAAIKKCKKKHPKGSKKRKRCVNKAKARAHA
jgi:CSLREA domain-containing protein